MERVIALALLVVGLTTSAAALYWYLRQRRAQLVPPAVPVARAIAAPAPAQAALTSGPSLPNDASSGKLASLVDESELDDLDVTKMGPAPALADSIPRLDGGEDDDESPETRSHAMLRFANDAEADETTGQHDLVLLTAQGQTDVGSKRKRNEDSVLVESRKSLFVVADGMGGYGGGDLASQTAVSTIEEAFESGTFAGAEVDVPAGAPPLARELAEAVGLANARILEKSKTSAKLTGMGTTIVGARFATRKQRVYIAHVGDSRCYRLRGRSFRAMTQDHTLAAYGVEGPMAGHLRRAVGVKEKVKVDLHVDKPLPGDIYLLCSDGLTKMVSEDKIREVIDAHGDDVQGAVKELIDAANAAGGRDNTSVILVAVKAPTDGRGGGGGARRSGDSTPRAPSTSASARAVAHQARVESRAAIAS